MLGKAGQKQRMEDPVGSGDNHVPGLFLGIGRFIDAGMNQGVKGIRQPHHLHPGSNAVSGQPVRITTPIPTLMVVAAYVADQRKHLAFPQFRYPLQQLTALGGVGLHNLKFLLGQVPRFIEDFLRNGPFTHIMEQGESGVELNLLCGQRRNDSSGGKGTQKPLRQVFKLYAVGRVVNEKLLPPQDSKSGFNVQFSSSPMVYGRSDPVGPLLFSVISSQFWGA